MLALISLDERVELTTVLAQDEISSLRAKHNASSVGHPSMACEVAAIKDLLFTVNVVQLTVISSELRIVNFEIFVG